MKISIFQVDAFTDQLFGGNPAAVCPLEEWLDDVLLQKIAIENNLSETAFFVEKTSGHYELRWFTPEIEMDLCGHATLASAFVIFEELGFQEKELVFETNSGELKVVKEGEYFEMEFPSRPPIRSALPRIISEGLSIQPIEVWKSRDYLLLYQNEKEISELAPAIDILNRINLDPGGIIVTAHSDLETVDFISRFFTPQASVFEDPVTGSAHCTLVPFWSERLKKNKLKALQRSNRGGELWCFLDGNKVKLKGKAVKYLEGVIFLK